MTTRACDKSWWGFVVLVVVVVKGTGNLISSSYAISTIVSPINLVTRPNVAVHLFYKFSVLKTCVYVCYYVNVKHACGLLTTVSSEEKNCRRSVDCYLSAFSGENQVVECTDTLKN